MPVLLANWLLEVDGRRFGVSGPQFGDETQAFARQDMVLTVGLTAADLPRVRDKILRPARLLTGDGREVAKLRIEKIDPELNLVVADVLEISPLLDSGFASHATPAHIR